MKRGKKTKNVNPMSQLIRSGLHRLDQLRPQVQESLTLREKVAVQGERQRIAFEIDRQLNSERQGFGLISIQERVNALGGSVTFESSEGGTSISILFTGGVV